MDLLSSKYPDLWVASSSFKKPPTFPPLPSHLPPQPPNKPVEPVHEPVLVRALAECRTQKGNYKDCLDRLHGTSGISAAAWKDYFLCHFERLHADVMHFVPSPAPLPMKKATIKKPNFEDFSDDSESSPPSSPPRRAKAISPPMRPASRSRKVSRDNIQQPLASGSRRQTVNSLTAHDLVYNARLPPPNTEVRIPPPPSRAPTPPTQAIPHNRGGYKFTPEDKEFFVRFIQWRLQDPVPITRNMLCEELAEKVPHHTTASWTAYWQNNHDLPDKILAAAWNRYYDAGGTTGPLPKPDNPEQSASGDEGDSENDDDLEIPTDDKSAMGEKGGPYTQADLGVMCRYVASFSEIKWDALSGKERWGPFANRYKERSAQSWGEYYKRHEREVGRFARQLRRVQGSERSGKRRLDENTTEQVSRRIRR